MCHGFLLLPLTPEMSHIEKCIPHDSEVIEKLFRSKRLSQHTSSYTALSVFYVDLWLGSPVFEKEMAFGVLNI
jgi:hypothetical protein